jgi:hypothetical protein
MANVLFPRTITITRPNAPASSGLLGYSGVEESNETTIAFGVPASIVLAGSGRVTGAALPGDSPTEGWTITIPALNSASLPQVNERDVVYDDFSPPRRFQVAAYVPSALGSVITAVRLKV